MKRFLLATIFLLSMACSIPTMTTPTPASPSATSTWTPIPPSETPSPIPSPTFTLTPSPSPTSTPTPTPIPTYAILRGTVLQRANCRYGPGVPYLYKYGLVPGSNLEIIGRLDDASWIYVQAIGGNNPCWVNVSLMDIHGDVWSIEPIYPDKAPLPVSPYYPPLGNVQATRDGDEITITWTGQALRAGDEEGPNSPLYVVEIWACENGEIHFTPYGLFYETLTVTDEAGCDEPSHGRVYFAEKHGYAGPSEIPWVPAQP